MPTLHLHTDDLESKYGLVKAEIIEQTEHYRIISIIDSTKITRTYAVTVFSLQPSTSMQQILSKVKAGGLVGKVAREVEAQITKVRLQEGEVRVTPQIQKKFNAIMPYAKYVLYKLYLQLPHQKSEIYGVICEVYSPDFIPPQNFGIDPPLFDVKPWVENMKHSLQ